LCGTFSRTVFSETWERLQHSQKLLFGMLQGMQQWIADFEVHGAVEMFRTKNPPVGGWWWFLR
jgi:hypothetical protein